VAGWFDEESKDELPAWWLPLVWAVLWVGGAVLQLALE
jgi:hypothetical protein